MFAEASARRRLMIWDGVCNLPGGWEERVGVIAWDEFALRSSTANTCSGLERHSTSQPGIRIRSTDSLPR